jgi:hypothetical protein
MGPFHWILVDFVAKVAWPIVIGGLAFTFRQEIKGVVVRIIEIGPTGAKIAPPPQQTAPAITGATALASKVGQQDEALSEFEQALRNHPEVQAAEKLSQNEAKEFFIREYAKLQIISLFQNITNNIFGTQVALLKSLRAIKMMSRNEVDEIYKTHVEKIRRSGVKLEPNFSLWITYLINSKLVASNSDGSFVLTPLGRKFVDEAIPAAGINEDTRGI